MCHKVVSKGSVLSECPINDLFQGVVIVFITSQTAVSELVENYNDNDNAWPLVVHKYW